MAEAVSCWRALRSGVLVAVAGLITHGALMAGAAALDPPQCQAGEILIEGACAATAEMKQRIDRIVRDAMVKHDLKAVLAGVAIGGQPVMNEAWGESMTGVPATPDMHFRNGAIAIAYLGTVLLQLQDKGLLSVDDKLAKWFPEYPKADQVSLLMLINGTSGYADYVNIDILPLYQNVFRQWQPDELIAIGLGQPMKCDPGTCWSYAHTNFVILGKVLEKATGRPLEELIKEGILDPLDLEDTRSEATAAIQEPVLHSYDGERGIYEESTYWNPSWTLARGAVMTSNIADILASAAAIGTGALVSSESHVLQLAPLTAKFKAWSETKYYGLGVFLVDGWIVQNPSFAGYAATMAYLPSRRLAIAVSATLREKASLEGNFSTDVLKEIAEYLAPGAPL